MEQAIKFAILALHANAYQALSGKPTRNTFLQQLCSRYYVTLDIYSENKPKHPLGRRLKLY